MPAVFFPLLLYDCLIHHVFIHVSGGRAAIPGRSGQYLLVGFYGAVPLLWFSLASVFESKLI